MEEKLKTKFAAALMVIAAIAQTDQSALAQAWPNKPISLVVPYAAGGGLDGMARLLANDLTQRLGQQVIVDIRAGANGTIGTNYAAKATPDGYTFLLDPGGPIVNAPFLVKDLPYDPERDLVPVTKIADSSVVVLANPKFPAADMTGLIAYAKANPGKVLAANVGVGSGGHLAALLLEQQAGIRFTHVPYTGTGQMMKDLISGEVPINFNFFGPGIAPAVDSGSLKVLAIAGTKVPAALQAKNVQTAPEAGFPKYLVEGWFAMFAPKGVPEEILAKMHAAVTSYLMTPAAKEKLLELGLDAAPTSSADLAKFIGEERKTWSNLIGSIDMGGK
jgi:tripartite-type tricarboxylate transporter receptor subunit TctC